MNWQFQDGWFSNEAGTGVQFGGRDSLGYRNGGRMTTISYEMVVSDAGTVQYWIYLHDQMQWEAPVQGVPLTAKDIDDVRSNIREAIVARPRSPDMPLPEIIIESRTVARAGGT